MFRLPFKSFHLLTAIAVVALVVSPAAAHDPDAIPDMLEKVLPGVVTIQAAGPAKEAKNFPELPEGSPLNDFFKNFPAKDKKPGAAPRPTKSQGSGFIFDASGLIVTNHHVIDSADTITVKLADGSEFPADVVGDDARTDIAVLRIKSPKPLAALQFGDSSKLRIGQQVIAIGNPFGLGASVASGIVSGLDRNLASGPYDHFIQTDAAINKGNAGGPLLDTVGQVVGMNTAIFSPSGGAVGVGFAIPSNFVADIAKTLADKGEVERGWLGVRIQGVTDDIAGAMGMTAPAGALVAGAETGGPADLAGMKAGDIVLEVNGEVVAGVRDLPRLVSALPPGERATFVVLRDGKRKTMSVVIGRLPTSSKPPKKPPQAQKDESVIPSTGAIKVLGMTLDLLTPDVRKKFSISEAVSAGVVVTATEPGGAASNAIKAGNVITDVMKTKVATPAEAAKALQKAAETRKSALVRIADNNNNQRFVGLPLAGMKIVAGSSSSDEPLPEAADVNELEKLE